MLLPGVISYCSSDLISIQIGHACIFCCPSLRILQAFFGAKLRGPDIFSLFSYTSIIFYAKVTSNWGKNPKKTKQDLAPAM